MHIYKYSEKVYGARSPHLTFRAPTRAAFRLKVASRFRRGGGAQGGGRREEEDRKEGGGDKEED